MKIYIAFQDMILLEIIEGRKEEAVYHFTFKDIWSITQETIYVYSMK